MDAFRSNLELKETSKGKGVFSKVFIPKDTTIFEFSGDIIFSSQVPKPLKPEDDHYLQIDNDKYIGPSGDLDDFINHSCFANCGIRIVGHRAFLFSLYDINRGIELTFDYSTTSTETKDNWQLNCKCGNFNCRKEISGFQYLNEEQKKIYKDLDAIPKYLK